MSVTPADVPGTAAASRHGREVPGSPGSEPARLLTLAVELAGRAGELMQQRRQGVLTVDTKSSATDLVTDADRAVEELLRGELARLRPGDTVLGEEGGEQLGSAADLADSAGMPGPADPAGPTGTPVRWVLDPIDGTVNYLLGLPQYAVSIAAQVDGVTVAGCVLNPVSGDLFRASLGGGAYLGDRRLSGPRSVPLAEAVVATGFGYDQRHRARQGQLVGQLLGHVGNLRRMGSAALDLCALATGWVDLYYEGPLGEWDFAAGLLIASEAGARLSGLRGRPPGPAMVAGGHRDNAEEFFELLTALGAAESG